MFLTKDKIEESIRTAIICDKSLSQKLKIETAISFARNVFQEFDLLHQTEKDEIITMIIDDASVACPNSIN